MEGHDGDDCPAILRSKAIDSFFDAAARLRPIELQHGRDGAGSEISVNSFNMDEPRDSRTGRLGIWRLQSEFRRQSMERSS